jgi:hypothetical protein
MTHGGDSMSGELIVLKYLTTMNALINSMAVICFTVVLCVLGSMAAWRLSAEKGERKTDLSTQGIFLEPKLTIRQ